MRLTRIRLANVRQYRDTEYRDLNEGLNLFVGANGAGKSSLVAAVRAAFLERFNTKKLEDLQGADHGKGPTVEVDFDWNGQRHALTKTFLKSASCVLAVDGRTLREDEAQGYLANLMGYSYAQRGAGAVEHWGIPGLLWVEQGTGQVVHDSVVRAANQLRGALQSTVQQVASTEGDALIGVVSAHRNELLTPKGGAPRGKYLEAIEAQARAHAGLEEASQTAQLFREKVDSIEVDHRELERLDRERPWNVAKARADTAQGELKKVQEQAAALAAKHAEVVSIQGQQRQIDARLVELDRQASDLATRRGRLGDLEAKVETATAALTHAERALKDAQDHYEATRNNERRALDAQRRADLQSRLDALRAGVGPRTEALEKARAAQVRLAELDTEIARLAPKAGAVEAAERHQAHVAQLQARLEGVASTVRFELDDGFEARARGERIANGGALPVTEPTTFEIAGVGRIAVMPGGTDVATFRDQLASANAAFAELLDQVGASTLDELRAAATAHAEALRQRGEAKVALDMLAPRGRPHLEAELLEAEAKCADLAGELATCPKPQGEVLPLDDVRADLRKVEARLNKLRDARMAAREDELRARQGLESEQREVGTLSERVEGEAFTRERQEQSQQLEDLATRLRLLNRECGDLQRAIAEARPDLLQQDVERYTQAAQTQKSARDSLDHALREKRVWVESHGALGIDEQVAQRERELEQADRRVRELERHARAWDHLLAVLTEERKQLTQQLQAPLQRRLEHYLPMLFPEGGIEVDDHLAPAALRLDRTTAAAALAFDELSFGTREQLGIVSRLAYADLLKEAGKPALLIFDDVLVHSDGQRLEAMKRALYDAGKRHQILLLTCHPERWSDLAAEPRRVEALA